MSERLKKLQAENEAMRGHAFSCGVMAFHDGEPMVAPDYDKESLQAAWRVGWKTAARGVERKVMAEPE
jgi:hypothetical protein